MAHIEDRWHRRVSGKKVRSNRYGIGKRWRVRYRAPNGEEVSEVFELRHEAERFSHSVEHSRSTGTFVDPRRGRELVGARALSWLESVTPALKPKTAKSYESLIRSRILPALGGRSLAGLRPSEIQEWVGRMQADGLSPSRIRQAVVVLRQVLDAAVRDGVIGRNPSLGVKLPRLVQREAAYFEPETVAAISAVIPAPYDLLTRLLGTLGPRWGEAVALRRRHVDLVRRRLVIEESLAEVSGRFVFGPTKSYAVRAMPLPPQLAGAVAAHLEEHPVPLRPDALLFTGPKGGPLRYRYYYMRLWRPTLAQLGLPPTGLHCLRHSAASRMIAAGASPKALQKVMGHKSAAFTLTVYGHAFDADLDELAARLDDSPASQQRPKGIHFLAADSDL